MSIRQSIRAVVAVAVVIVIGTQPASAAPMTVEEFNLQKDKWDRFASVKTRLHIQGRFASMSTRTLRMEKCRLQFRPSDSLRQFPSARHQDSNLELTGTLQRSGRTVIFMVDSVRELHSDMDDLRTKQRTLRSTIAEGWYKLGDQTLARATFYEDEELRTQALKLYERGVHIEYGQLLRDDFVGRRRLSEKAAEYGLGDRLRQELLHESLHLEWIAIRQDPMSELKAFRDRIAKQLPGCETPAPDDTDGAREKYISSSLTTYREADDDVRKLMHRFFFADVVLQDILRQAEKNGDDGFAVADRLEAVLPERSGLAEEHRMRELEKRLTNVVNLRQPEMDHLAEQFEQRGLTEKAGEARRKWVEGQVRQRWTRGTRAQLSAADLQLDILNDKKTAIEMAQRAWFDAKDKGAKEEAERWLAGHGLHRDGNHWVSGESGESDERFNDALTPQKGMSPADVRRAMAGSPTRQVRIATSGRIEMIWIYRDAGATPLAVYFSRESLSANPRFRVVAISALSR